MPAHAVFTDHLKLTAAKASTHDVDVAKYDLLNDNQYLGRFKQAPTGHKCRHTVSCCPCWSMAALICILAANNGWNKRAPCDLSTAY